MTKAPESPADGEPERVPFGALDVPVTEKTARVRGIFESVASRYDVMNDLMSGGLHRLWKAAAVDWLRPHADQDIIDVAGGTGDIAMRIVDAAGGAQAFATAGGSVRVLDINEAMMAMGRKRVTARHLAGTISFVAADAEALPLPSASVDAYIIAFGLRNMTRPERALQEAARVLRQGGRFLCLEFSHPRLPLLGPVYARYSDTVLPWLGERVAGDRAAYRYLVESIRRFPDQERLARMIADAGLDQVKVRDLSGGIAAMHSAWRI